MISPNSAEALRGHQASFADNPWIRQGIATALVLDPSLVFDPRARCQGLVASFRDRGRHAELVLTNHNGTSWRRRSMPDSCAQAPV
jgi:hypothetical protein